MPSGIFIAPGSGKLAVGSRVKLALSSYGVLRSNGSVEVIYRCRSTGLAYYQSKSNGGVWGNLLSGGVVGYAIDAGSGSGFDYPTLMTVEMGIIQAAPPKREEPKPAGSQVMVH